MLYCQKMIWKGKPMNGEERREAIIQLIKSSDIPLSGGELAKQLKVSRQIVVQDIALLRAANLSIMSTHRGYVLDESDTSITRVFKVKHTDEQIEDELNGIIDVGGKVLDVVVKHPIYGVIKAPLEIYSRRDVAQFIKSMKEGEATPLKNMTCGVHYHTISAYSMEILDEVEEILRQKGYLVEID